MQLGLGSRLRQSIPWRFRKPIANISRSNQSILKEINPEYSLEGLMLKLKFQYFCHLMCLILKDPDAGKDWRREEKGATENEMVGWHQWLKGCEFEQTLGDSEGQGSLACSVPGGTKSWIWLSSCPRTFFKAVCSASLWGWEGARGGGALCFEAICHFHKVCWDKGTDFRKASSEQCGFEWGAQPKELSKRKIPLSTARKHRLLI